MGPGRVLSSVSRFVHWRAAEDGKKRQPCVQGRVHVCHVTWLTAMADLTLCSWKKTLLPSSGHTVLISSLVIPSSSLPVRTPSVFTVLQRHPWVFHAWRGRALTLSTHILEKPLCSSQALTSGGVEFMSRVTAPRGFHCEEAQMERS